MVGDRIYGLPESYLTQLFINVSLWKVMGSKYTCFFRLDLVIISDCDINWMHAGLIPVYEYIFFSNITRYIPPCFNGDDRPRPSQVYHYFVINYQTINDDITI